MAEAMSRSRHQKKSRAYCSCWLCSPKARAEKMRRMKADSEIAPYRAALLAAKLDAARRIEIAQRESEKLWSTVAW